MVQDLLKLGKALRDMDAAVAKFVDANGLGQIDHGAMKRGEMASLVAEINRYKTEVQHERTLFETRLKFALSAADNDLKKLESLEAGKKRELWKGFGIDL